MNDDTQPTGYFCRTEQHCKAYDTIGKHPAPVSATDPLCDTCLTVAEADVRKLLWDYVDLAQMQAPSMSQALSLQPSGKAEPAMPMKGHPEALQAEIVHVLTTWETEVRARARLSEPADHVRDGAAVQRAIDILAPRLRLLARIQPTTVYPTGCEDDPQDMAGWEAIHHLQRLRTYARGLLGWTNRNRWVPGDCWNCDGRDADQQDGPLWRADPRFPLDPAPINCDRCKAWRPWDDYQHYLVKLEWPTVQGRLAEAAA